MRWLIFLGLLTLGFCAARFYIPTHPVSAAGSYTALAHVFVGLLIGAFLATPSNDYLWEKDGGFVPVKFTFPRKAIYFLFIVVLCSVELFAFFSGTAH